MGKVTVPADEHVNLKEKKKKKHKHGAEIDGLMHQNGGTGAEEFSLQEHSKVKEKKKKQKKDRTSDVLENHAVTETKSKKASSVEVQYAEEIQEDITGNASKADIVSSTRNQSAENNGVKSKNKKHKAKEQAVSNDTDNAEHKKRKRKAQEEIESSEKKKKRKKEQKKDEMNCTLSPADHTSLVSNTCEPDIAQENVPRSGKKRKKSKKSKHSDRDSILASSVGIPLEGKISLPGDNEMDEQQGKDEKKRDKKQKQSLPPSCVSNDSGVEEGASGSGDSITKSKNHKKSKKSSKDRDEDLSTTDMQDVTEIQYKKHKKKRDRDVFKSDKQEDSTRSEVNKTDSEAKKVCVDMNSDVKAQNDSSTSLQQGQWQGNLFENSARQNKFLRLLGGMKAPSSVGESKSNVKPSLFSSQNGTKKKGLFGSLASQVSANKPVGGNVALSVTAAASLDQRLEDDYNRAMGFRFSGKKGMGLGFAPDPAEGKNFHIDVNKSKAVKFDD